MKCFENIKGNAYINAYGIKMLMLVSLVVLSLQIFMNMENDKAIFSGEKTLEKRAIESKFLKIICLFVTDLFFLYAAKIINISFTVYESAALLLIISVIVSMVKNWKKAPNIIFNGIYFCAIIIACYSTMTYGTITINSDSATSILLARSQIEAKSFFPESWCCANGEIWTFAQNLFAIPWTYIIKNQVFVRVLQGVLWYLLAIICIKKYFTQICKSDAWLIATPILLITLQGEIRMILYETAYVSALIAIPILLFIAWKVYQDPKRKGYLAVGFVFCWFLTMSGFRPLAEYSLPLCAAFLLLGFEKLGKDLGWKKEIIRISVVVIWVSLSSILGAIGYNILGKTRIINNTVNGSMLFVDSVETIVNNFVYYLRAFFEIFGFRGNVSLISIYGLHNLISIVLTIMMCFVIPILQFRCLSKENDFIKILFYYSLIHNVIMFIMVVCTGKINAPRYVLTSVFLCVFISARYIMEYWINKYKEKGICLAFFWGIVILINATIIVENSNNWVEELENKKSVSQELKEHDLEYGVASYWNAYSNVIYSDFDVKILGITFDQNAKPIPFRWLVDSEWFEDGDQYEKTFLMLTMDEVNHMTENGAFELFGEPIEQFAIDETGLSVYVYDYNVMDVID